MPNRFYFSAEEMRTAESNLAVEEARRKIRRAQKKTAGCSEACLDILIGHSLDCPNRNRYDVV